MASSDARRRARRLRERHRRRRRAACCRRMSTPTSPMRTAVTGRARRLGDEGHRRRRRRCIPSCRIRRWSRTPAWRWARRGFPVRRRPTGSRFRCSTTTSAPASTTSTSPASRARSRRCCRCCRRSCRRSTATATRSPGLKSPLLQNPLGTYLGYNTFPSGFQKGQTCIQNSPAGGYVAFAETKAAREAVGDPRPSLEERYGTRENWLAGVKASANAMVVQRYLTEGGRRRDDRAGGSEQRHEGAADGADGDGRRVSTGPPRTSTSTRRTAPRSPRSTRAPSWKRTGQSFKAFVSGSSQGQGTAVCRNYGTSRRGDRRARLQRQRGRVHELHHGAAVEQLDARIGQRVRSGAAVLRDRRVPEEHGAGLSRRQQSRRHQRALHDRARDQGRDAREGLRRRRLRADGRGDVLAARRSRARRFADPRGGGPHVRPAAFSFASGASRAAGYHGTR